MYNQLSHTTNNHSKSFRLAMVLLFSLLGTALWSKTVFYKSGEDSSKVYPLNDPRNPNCPCHKIQQLADEEFKNLNNPIQQKINTSNIQKVIQTNLNNNPIASNIDNIGEQIQQFDNSLNIQTNQSFDNNDDTNEGEQFGGEGFSFSSPQIIILKSTSSYSSKKTKRKKFKKKYHQIKRRLNVSNWGWSKKWKDITLCYNWS